MTMRRVLNSHGVPYTILSVGVYSLPVNDDDYSTMTHLNAAAAVVV